MTHRVKLTSLAACAFACALVALAIVCPRAAWANAAVYTATATPSYTNPVTGAVEDSGGESGQTLGATMVTGIVQPEAFVQDQGNGEVLVSVRFYEADQIGDVTVAASADGSSYGASQQAEKLSTNAETNMVDLQLTAANTTPTLRFEMYVTPMGRSVTFFVTISDLAEGNTAGFAQTIDVDALNAASAESSSASAGSESNASSESSVSTSGDSVKGVSEYNADGNQVKDGAADNGADSLNYPLIIGIILAVVVVAGIIVYVAVLKPNRAKQDAAAAAAAAAARGPHQGDRD